MGLIMEMKSDTIFKKDNWSLVIITNISRLKSTISIPSFKNNPEKFSWGKSFTLGPFQQYMDIYKNIFLIF